MAEIYRKVIWKIIIVSILVTANDMDKCTLTLPLVNQLENLGTNKDVVVVEKVTCSVRGVIAVPYFLYREHFKKYCCEDGGAHYTRRKLDHQKIRTLYTICSCYYTIWF